MEFDWHGKLFIPPGGPPQGIGPSREIFSAMGAENIYRMLEDFYAVLDKSEIRPLFPEDMKASSRKSAAFFIGLLGGPPLYAQIYGDPAMRRRHMAFPINEEARQVWFKCFCDTLAGAEEKYGFPEKHLPGFIHFLDEFSKWMVNRV